MYHPPLVRSSCHSSLSKISSRTTTHPDIYEQLKQLPCFESLPWGWLSSSDARGLLRRYITEAEASQDAAHLPRRLCTQAEKKAAAEAFYCALVAGDTTFAISLQRSRSRSCCPGDWEYIVGLFKLQDEATSIPFVSPSPFHPIIGSYDSIRTDSWSIRCWRREPHISHLVPLTIPLLEKRASLPSIPLSARLPAAKKQ